MYTGVNKNAIPQLQPSTGIGQELKFESTGATDWAGTGSN